MKSEPCRLICFHHAGGASAFFGKWLAAAPSEIDMHLVQLPGRWNRSGESAQTDMGSLIRFMEPELATIGKGKFAVLGYSFGSFVAFEWIRHLRNLGATLPIAFFPVAMRAPQIPLERPLPIYKMSDSDLVAAIAANYGPIPAVILEDDELRAMVIKIIRADMQVFETYAYAEEAPLDLPIVAFGGASDTSATPTRMAAWAKQTSKSFDLQVFEGGHFFGETKFKEILAVVNERLRES